MDPLSDILSLLKPRSYASGGFRVEGDVAIRFPRHQGIKCYAVLSGDCWLSVEGAGKPMLLREGDCFLLLRGLPFSLATELSLTPVDFQTFRHSWRTEPYAETEVAGRYLAGGHFVLGGEYADLLLQSLPPIVHIRKERDRAAMRWSLDRMREELAEPQPGGSLMAQQLATVMLVQALRLHLEEGTRGGVGWLFALADRQMGAALAAVHESPGQAWTVQALAERAGMSRSIFAERFKETVGKTPMEYLTGWRMLLAAERLKLGNESLCAIAGSLGYDSESAFGKAFRRVMGSSPRRYSRGGSEGGVRERRVVEAGRAGERELLAAG